MDEKHFDSGGFKILAQLFHTSDSWNLNIQFSVSRGCIFLSLHSSALYFINFPLIIKVVSLKAFKYALLSVMTTSTINEFLFHDLFSNLFQTGLTHFMPLQGQSKHPTCWSAPSPLYHYSRTHAHFSSFHIWVPWFLLNMLLITVTS